MNVDNSSGKHGLRCVNIKLFRQLTVRNKEIPIEGLPSEKLIGELIGEDVPKGNDAF
jgi:hypothetical protein